MTEQTLTGQWKLKQLLDGFVPDASSLAAQSGCGDWLTVERMPAMVQDVLLQNGKIEEPWKPGKAREYLWIAQSEWLYQATFSCETPEKTSELIFGGIDTVASVYLNGELLFDANNCYMPWKADVTGKLKRENTLWVYFPSVQRVLDSIEIPASMRGKLEPFRFLRKPHNSFTDYLGPKPYFIKVGLYADVCLAQYEEARLEQAYVTVSLDESLTAGTIHYEISGRADRGNASVRAVLSRSGATVLEQKLPVISRDGAFSAVGVLKVENPELWWPRGYGRQPLYDLEFILSSEGRKVQSDKKLIGFRRITYPAPYEYAVNNRRIVLLGANLAPFDSATLCWNRKRVETLFDIAENGHFNILRVWGEMGPVDDELYEMADRRGFLIWCDFNNCRHILDEGFRADNILKDISYQLEHLKHHPCILLWCGGNESYLWANRRTLGAGPYIGRKTIKRIRELAARRDPERQFLDSTPMGGAFPNDPQGGNTHGYTNMWFVPGYKHMKFVTEDTRIGPPGLKSLERFFAPEDIWPEDYLPVYSYGKKYPWPDSWDKYASCLAEQKIGPAEEFYDADSAGELVYRLGAAQGIYYRRAIEDFRRGRDADSAPEDRRTSGYMFWKLNDSWPQIYSAKVDYFLEPNIPYYFIRRAYEPLMVSFDTSLYLDAWVCNDSAEDFVGVLKINLFDMEKNCVVEQTQRHVEVKAGQSVLAARCDEFTQFSKRYVLFAELYDFLNEVAARTVDYTEIERRLTFPEAELTLAYEDGELIITTDRFAKCVELAGDDDGDAFGWLFEDNYFDLVPGETKRVKILGRHNKGVVSAKAHFSPKAAAIELK